MREKVNRNIKRRKRGVLGREERERRMKTTASVGGGGDLGVP